MTVAELIEKLKKWPMHETVVIDDDHTGWEMPLIEVGYGEYGQQRDLKTGELDTKVHLWGARDV